MDHLKTGEGLCDSLKAHTADNGINSLNVFVEKPFIKHLDGTKADAGALCKFGLRAAINRAYTL